MPVTIYCLLHAFSSHPAHAESERDVGGHDPSLVVKVVHVGDGSSLFTLGRMDGWMDGTATCYPYAPTACPCFTGQIMDHPDDVHTKDIVYMFKLNNA
jgi:hypothetical protein